MVIIAWFNTHDTDPKLKLVSLYSCSLVLPFYFQPLHVCVHVVVVHSSNIYVTDSYSFQLKVMNKISLKILRIMDNYTYSKLI
jgi:hypothetical protein